MSYIKINHNKIRFSMIDNIPEKKEKNLHLTIGIQYVEITS